MKKLEDSFIHLQECDQCLKFFLCNIPLPLDLKPTIEEAMKKCREGFLLDMIKYIKICKGEI